MKLNPQKIIDVKFESVINGYSPTKVDQFLDKVIDDYNEMMDKINFLEAENAKLKSEIDNLKKANSTIDEENEELSEQ